MIIIRGPRRAPFATLQRAQRAVRAVKNASSRPKVVILEGTYYLETPLTFSSEDSGTRSAPVIFAAAENQRVTLSGGRKLACAWTSYKNGVMMSKVPAGLDFSQLFIDGKRQIRARYPNYDSSNPGKSGYFRAASPIPPGTPNPYAGADEDMTYSTPSPSRHPIRSFDLLQQEMVKARGC